MPEPKVCQTNPSSIVFFSLFLSLPKPKTTQCTAGKEQKLKTSNAFVASLVIGCVFVCVVHIGSCCFQVCCCRHRRRCCRVGITTYSPTYLACFPIVEFLYWEWAIRSWHKSETRGCLKDYGETNSLTPSLQIIFFSTPHSNMHARQAPFAAASHPARHILQLHFGVRQDHKALCFAAQPDNPWGNEVAGGLACKSRREGGGFRFAPHEQLLLQLES